MFNPTTSVRMTVTFAGDSASIARQRRAFEKKCEEMRIEWRHDRFRVDAGTSIVVSCDYIFQQDADLAAVRAFRAGGPATRETSLRLAGAPVPAGLHAIPA